MRAAAQTRDPAIAAVAARYAVAITPAMERLIDPADPADPIALQFRPGVRELETTPEERADPIDDGPHSPVEGVVHRYRDRCLLKITHVCPVYCRFCFRREMVGPGKAEPITEAKLDAAFFRISPTWLVVSAVVLVRRPRALTPILPLLLPIKFMLELTR